LPERVSGSPLPCLALPQHLPGAIAPGAEYKRQEQQQKEAHPLLCTCLPKRNPQPCEYEGKHRFGCSNRGGAQPPGAQQMMEMISAWLRDAHPAG